VKKEKEKMRRENKYAASKDSKFLKPNCSTQSLSKQQILGETHFWGSRFRKKGKNEAGGEKRG